MFDDHLLSEFRRWHQRTTGCRIALLWAPPGADPLPLACRFVETAVARRERPRVNVISERWPEVVCEFGLRAPARLTAASSALRSPADVVLFFGAEQLDRQTFARSIPALVETGGIAIVTASPTSMPAASWLVELRGALERGGHEGGTLDGRVFLMAAA